MIEGVRDHSVQVTGQGQKVTWMCLPKVTHISHVTALPFVKIDCEAISCKQFKQTNRGTYYKQHFQEYFTHLLVMIFSSDKRLFKFIRAIFLSFTPSVSFMYQAFCACVFLDTSFQMTTDLCKPIYILQQDLSMVTSTYLRLFTDFDTVDCILIQLFSYFAFHIIYMHISYLILIWK